MATASAVSNTYSAPGIMLGATYPDLLDTSFAAVRKRDWAEPIQGEKFFNTINTDRSSYKTTTISGDIDLPPINDDSENVPWTQPAPGFDITWTPLDFRNGIRITRKMRETDQWGAIQKMWGGLLRSYRLKREYLLSDVYNNAFATNLGADGMYMCDTVHPCQDPAAGTWDNVQTSSALTQASLRLMRLAMRNRVSDKGFLNPIVMKTLLVPNELQDQAEMLISSTLRAEDSLHGANVYKDAFKIETWDWLTSATAFFGIGPMGVGHEIYQVVRVAPQTESWVDGTNPDVFCQRIRFSMTAGFEIPYNVEGNAGA